MPSKFKMKGSKFNNLLKNSIKNVYPETLAFSTKYNNIEHIRFETNETGMIRAISSNSSTMSILTSECINLNQSDTFEVHRIQANGLLRTFKKSKEIHIETTHDHIYFTDKTNYIDFPRPEVEFPKWEKVILDDVANKILIHTNEMYATLKSMFSGVTQKMIKKDIRRLKLSFDKDDKTLCIEPTPILQSKAQEYIELVSTDNLPGVPESIYQLAEGKSCFATIHNYEGPNEFCYVQAGFLENALSVMPTKMFTFGYGEIGNMETMYVGKQMVWCLYFYPNNYKGLLKDSPTLQLVMPMRNYQ